MKALVTGVAGFIGSHIAERLLALGHDVIGIDDLSAGYTSNIPDGVFFVNTDVCDIEKHHTLLQGIDVVFHDAASKKNICMCNPARDMQVNGIGTLLLLKECVKHKVGKFVHASTGSVYGEVEGVITENTPRHPCSYYGISKTAGESYVSLFGDRLDVTVLRYFHVYGARQEKDQVTGGVVAIFSDKIKRGLEIILHGDGSQKRVFTSVADIVEANIQAWRNPLASGKIYNCASSTQTSVKELAEMLMKKFNKKVPIRYMDPLVGDIYNFNVSTESINELGVTFSSITDVL